MTAFRGTGTALFAAVLLTFSAVAADPERGDANSKPYVDQPAVVAELDKLGDNTALVLPPFTAAGAGVEEWRKAYHQVPTARDFCNKMAYAPDRATGMYCGMSHGSPHRLNDAWEYHLGSNTWHLLFAPDGDFWSGKLMKNTDWVKQNVILKDGYLQTKRGAMLDSCHTWSGLTYDPGSRCMLWANGGWGGADDLKVYAEANGLKKQDLLKELKPGSKLWMYDSREGRWRKQMGEGPMPLIRSAGLLEYIPDWKKSIWFASNWNEIGMWTYDAKANTWAELKPNGGRNFYHDNKDRTFPGAELQGAYSSRHKKLVAVKDTRTWLYDLTKNEWSRACDDPENDAHDARSVFAYDDVNDVFLLQQPHKKSLRAFRITTNKWETLQPKGAGLSSGKLGYFDSARNAFVIHQHDRVWVYRYKTAAK